MMVEEVVLSQNLVYGMENPLLDIIADVDDALIEKYKLKRNLQNYLGNVEVPLFEELLQTYNAKSHGGGGTYNSLKIFQWMIQEPKKVATFVACVGSDRLGEMIMKDAPSEYLDMNYYIMRYEPTGSCALLINNGYPTSASRHGGIGKFDEEFFESPRNQSLIEKAQYFFMAGFFLVAGETSFVKLGKHAAMYNKPFMFNISAVYLTISYKDRLNRILPYTDYLFCNEKEARSYAKECGYPWDDLQLIVNWMRLLPKENTKRDRVVIVTQGRNDTIVSTSEGIKFFPVVPLDPKDIIDMSSTGHAFCGGFLSQLVKGKPLEDCMAAGHYASSVIIRQVGCEVPKFKPDFK